MRKKQRRRKDRRRPRLHRPPVQQQRRKRPRQQQQEGDVDEEGEPDDRLLLSDSEESKAEESDGAGTDIDRSEYPENWSVLLSNNFNSSCLETSALGTETPSQEPYNEANRWQSREISKSINGSPLGVR